MSTEPLEVAVAFGAYYDLPLNVARVLLASQPTDELGNWSRVAGVVAGMSLLGRITTEEHDRAVAELWASQTAALESLRAEIRSLRNQLGYSTAPELGALVLPQ